MGKLFEFEKFLSANQKSSVELGVMNLNQLGICVTTQNEDGKNNKSEWIAFDVNTIKSIRKYINEYISITEEREGRKKRPLIY